MSSKLRAYSAVGGIGARARLLAQCVTIEWKRDNLTVTTDLARFDTNFVVSALQSAWRKGASGERIQAAFANAHRTGLLFGS